MAWPFDSLIKDVYLPHFQKYGEEAIPGFVNGIVSRQAFLSAYKDLSPIETMDEKEKREMKAYVISLFPEKTAQDKLEACKIIYTIGTLL